MAEVKNETDQLHNSREASCSSPNTHQLAQDIYQRQADRQKACILTARAWLEQDLVFLDTETTGLGTDDEIVQVAVISRDGNTLLDALVRPKNPIPEAATMIHGITNSDVARALSAPEILDDLRVLLRNRLACIYNADFDTRLINQTAQLWGVEPIEIDAKCVMRLYASYAGIWNDHRNDWRWWKLRDAAESNGLGNYVAHSARADAKTTAKLLKHMARHTLC